VKPEGIDLLLSSGNSGEVVAIVELVPAIIVVGSTDQRGIAGSLLRVHNSFRVFLGRFGLTTLESMQISGAGNLGKDGGAAETVGIDSGILGFGITVVEGLLCGIA
jgi:hypothetical protein